MKSEGSGEQLLEALDTIHKVDTSLLLMNL